MAIREANGGTEPAPPPCGSGVRVVTWSSDLAPLTDCQYLTLVTLIFNEQIPTEME